MLRKAFTSSSAIYWSRVSSGILLPRSLGCQKLEPGISCCDVVVFMKGSGVWKMRGYGGGRGICAGGLEDQAACRERIAWFWWVMIDFDIAIDVETEGEVVYWVVVM